MLFMGALGLVLAMPAGAATACLVTCAGVEKCTLESPSSPPKPLAKEAFTRIDDCENWKVGEQVSVLLRYRREGKWFQPAAQGPGKDLKTVFASFPADQPCSLPTSSCLQDRMGSKIAAKAGHGVDSQLGAPAGTNAPCTIGLPCGTVLPPAENWSFRLADASFNGRWSVRITRGAAPAGVPTAFDAPVAAGAVQVDGRRFTAGGVYAYRLIDSSGKETATGEFAVLSTADHGLLKRVAARRVEQQGMSESAAWIDALFASELDWDANQQLLRR